ncbi:MAG: hypothetical protein ACRD1N_00340, partial [Terriglobia bacterium]
MIDAAGCVIHRLARDLDLLQAENQLRSLAEPAGIPLDSNDYLSLARDPRLKRAIIEALNQGSQIAS